MAARRKKAGGVARGQIKTIRQVTAGEKRKGRVFHAPGAKTRRPRR